MRFGETEKFGRGLKTSAAKEKVSLENRNARPKIQIVRGKRNRQPNFRVFG
jgi:hypothetical protein